MAGLAADEAKIIHFVGGSGVYANLPLISNFLNDKMRECLLLLRVRGSVKTLKD